MIILIIFIITLLSIVYIAVRNTKVNNKILEGLFSLLKSNGFNIKELEQNEFKKIRINGILNFYPKNYYVEGIGFISTMTVNIGIMQMISINFNPFEKDLYELNIDLIFIFNKRTFIFEFYNLVLDKENIKNKLFLTKINKINEKYSEFENFKTIKGWYDSLISSIIAKNGKSNQDEKLFNLSLEIILNYIEYSKQIPKIQNISLIRKKIAEIENFGNRLVKEGGFSINNFKKSIGDEKTKKFLGEVFYGYNAYKDLKKI